MTACVVVAPPPRIDLHCRVAIVGGGACGLTAAIWARPHGAQEVLVLERDAINGGSSALSSGFVPAAGTRMQQALGIDDSAKRFASDIMAKAHGSADPVLLQLYAGEIAAVIDTLAAEYGLAFEVLEGFLYPGHTAARMHALPQRNGAALMPRLLDATTEAQVHRVNDAHVQTIFVDDTRRVIALGVTRPDKRVEYLGCNAVILACNGLGGNPALVDRFLPQMRSSLYFGNRGNQGDALLSAIAGGAVAGRNAAASIRLQANKSIHSALRSCTAQYIEFARTFV